MARMLSLLMSQKLFIPLGLLSMLDMLKMLKLSLVPGLRLNLELRLI